MEAVFALKQTGTTIKGFFEGELKNQNFSGKKDEFFLKDNILHTGLGKKEEFSDESARIAAANAAKYLRTHNYKEFSIIPFQDKIVPVTEGIMLGLYQFLDYKTQNLEDIKKVEKVFVVGKEVQKNSFEKTKKMCEIVNTTRNIQNMPANAATPEFMENFAKELAKKYKLKISVWDKKELEKKGFNGVLCVGQGSTKEPRLVVLEYNPKGKKKICLVGKGVTFDSGGLNIKPGDSMLGMKFDMSGAAAVFGSMQAIAELKLDVHAFGITPFVENMPDGNSYRPGDVIKMASGKTAEIINTDAEGRMILADALYYATTLKPDFIVDFATLTGACMVALGYYYAGIMGNDEDLIKKIIEAGQSTGEKVWQLPLTDEYREDIKSDIADVKHLGERWGGAITAAMFLKEFVGDTKWAHLDIAGTANVDKEKPYKPVGGTGFGVRLIAELLEKMKK